MKKLTRAQMAAWEAIKYLVEQNKDTWNGFRRGNDGIISGESKWGAPHRTLRGLEVAGLIELEPDVLFGNSRKFRLTATGRAAIADTESVKVGGQWTDAELDAYDPDEPMPPMRPGEFTIPPEQVQYEYEIAALKRKLARAEAALRDIERMAMFNNETLATGRGSLLLSISVRATEGLAGE